MWGIRGIGHLRSWVACSVKRCQDNVKSPSFMDIDICHQDTQCLPCLFAAGPTLFLFPSHHITSHL